MVEDNITALFRKWVIEIEKPIILLNKDNVPVGAVYPKEINPEKLIVCKIDRGVEKYYIYQNGLSVFFSGYKKDY